MNICKTTQPQKRKNKEETQQLPGRKCKGKRTTNDSPTTGAGASSTASATTKNNNDIAVETTFPPLNRHQGSTTPPSPDDTENLLSGPLLLTPKEDQNQFSASVAARESKRMYIWMSLFSSLHLLTFAIVGNTPQKLSVPMAQSNIYLPILFLKIDPLELQSHPSSSKLLLILWESPMNSS